MPNLGQLLGLFRADRPAVPPPEMFQPPASPPAAGVVDGSHWDLRRDGTKKGDGYLGALMRPDGDVMSEFSIAESENPKLRGPHGEYRDYPTLIPTLTRREVMTLLHANPEDPLPESIMRKAEAHALARLAKGEPVFAQPGEQHMDMYRQLMRAFVR